MVRARSTDDKEFQEQYGQGVYEPKSDIIFIKTWKYPKLGLVFPAEIALVSARVFSTPVLHTATSTDSE
jgi:hypothetical protein